MAYPKICAEIGYTTFWDDFSIADAFGIKAIKDTYKRGLQYAKTDYKAYTEFVMVLNHKCCEWLYRDNMVVSKLYFDLYYKAYNNVDNVIKDDKELSYYYRTLD